MHDLDTSFFQKKKLCTSKVQICFCIVQTYLDLLDAIAGFTKGTAALIVIIVG